MVILSVAEIWPTWFHSGPLPASPAGSGHKMLTFGNLIRALSRHEKDKGRGRTSLWAQGGVNIVKNQL